MAHQTPSTSEPQFGRFSNGLTRSAGLPPTRQARANLRPARLQASVANVSRNEGRRRQAGSFRPFWRSGLRMEVFNRRSVRSFGGLRSSFDSS